MVRHWTIESPPFHCSRFRVHRLEGRQMPQELSTIPDSLRSYGALQVIGGSVLRERIEAEPGDLKLVVFRVIEGT